MNAVLKQLLPDFDSTNIECVRGEFIRLADEIDFCWEHGDLAAACNAMEDFGKTLRESDRTGSAECRKLKRSLLDSIDALIDAWPTTHLDVAVGHITGLAEAMKSN